MSAAIVVGVALLGGAGAVGRFVLDGTVTARVGRAFPYGTLAVNLTGALALGLLHGAGVGTDAIRLVGTGLLGAYTTFSTWAFESQRQAEDGHTRGAFANLGISLVLGIACAWLGRELGTAL